MSSENSTITIRDIAALAGVSAGTVSRVMNNKPGVGAETRLRIAALIEEHGFRGDATARQLSTGRSNCIGVVFPLQVSEVVLHPVYPELLGAITDAAQLAGYDVMLFTTKVTDGTDHILDAVRRKRVDGLILPAASSDDALLQNATTLRVPTVLVGHRHREEFMTWADCDHDEALSAMAMRLLERGRRRLTLANGPQRISAYQLRSAGFWRAVRAFDPAPESVDELELDMTYAAGVALSATLLQRDRLPDAVLCSSDATAAGLMDALTVAGIRIPHQIAVTGFDDSDLSRHTTPPLTSVRMPLYETGTAAFELLLAMLEKNEAGFEPRILDSHLIPRESD